MSQVVRTTNDIIVNSLYLLGELGVDETPDAFMLRTGLDLLNELLGKFTADSIYIPFLTKLNFILTPGKASYTISDMITGADITADRVVDLSFAQYAVPTYGALSPTYAENFTANSSNSTISPMSGTGNYLTGTPIIMTAGVNGLLPGPIVSEQVYYTIYVDSQNVRIANSPQNAYNNIFIPITNNGLPPNLISIAGQISPFPVTSTDNTIIYPLQIISKAEYYNVSRQAGLTTRPVVVFLDKQANESIITFYPAPSLPYPVQLEVKCMIDQLSNEEDISELPPYYYGFLKYALARKFLAYYPSGNWPQQNEDEYQDYYNNLKNANETDLSIRSTSMFMGPDYYYWANILSY